MLAILIPTLNERVGLFYRVVDQINKQRVGKPVIIILKADDGEMTTGAKRNWCLDEARRLGATYISFVDDDDLVGPTYVQRGIETMEGGYDCAELYGRIYFHNKPGNLFHHSIEYDHWFQTDKMYMRNPNHLNFIKLEHLRDIRFKNINFGEDGNFSIDVQKTGRLKNQYPVKDVLYHYFNGKKNHVLEPTLMRQNATI